LTEEHFNRKGVQVEIIYLGGAVELAPLVGLSDLVVDLVQTGRTLQSLGLGDLDRRSQQYDRVCRGRQHANDGRVDLRSGSYPLPFGTLEVQLDEASLIYSRHQLWDFYPLTDIEVSGFPSQHAGHLCLLRLKEDDYEYPQAQDFAWKFGSNPATEGHFKGTKTTEIGEWPSWDLPILKWGKDQGGVVGFSHSGWGLALPDYGPGGERIPLVNRAPPPGARSNRSSAGRFSPPAGPLLSIGRRGH
jgi:hypothetical protein